ncbi:hypothetical protein QE152_g9697 [Popillia japonica]|uniref:Uncharacterized protein n=1 Tax=Popillia japonica TaxID=7064 RepID=A0AAW1LXD5_POPJA
MFQRLGAQKQLPHSIVTKPHVTLRHPAAKQPNFLPLYTSASDFLLAVLNTLVFIIRYEPFLLAVLNTLVFIIRYEPSSNRVVDVSQIIEWDMMFRLHGPVPLYPSPRSTL